MKGLFLVLILCVFNLAIAASNISTPVNCTGEAVFDGAYADLNCVNGNCTGWIPLQRIQVEGNCDQGVVFEAQGELQQIFVSGICNGSVVSSNAFSQNVSLYGDCNFQDIFYGSFYSTVYSPTGSAAGYCQENGTSRIYFSGGRRPVSGRCRQN